MTGRFVTFEGGEGAGKSTQVKRLAETLRAKGRTVITTREPGGTPGAEDIRKLLVTGERERWLPLSEALLFAAARYDHVERVIKPALERRDWVLCDRFADSTLVYQGYGMGQDETTLRKVQDITLNGFAPDLTFVLDVEPSDGLSRVGEVQRYEEMGRAFHRKLREGFLAVAKTDPKRYVVIDAGGTIEETTRRITSELNTRFGLAL